MEIQAAEKGSQGLQQRPEIFTINCLIILYGDSRLINNNISSREQGKQGVGRQRRQSTIALFTSNVGISILAQVSLARTNETQATGRPVTNFLQTLKVTKQLINYPCLSALS